MNSNHVLACPSGVSKSNQFRTTIFIAAALMTSASFAQTVPDIDRWTGGTAIAPANGHAMGNSLTLTWGFFRDGFSIDGGTSNLITRFDTQFGNGGGGSDLTNRPWFTHFNASYQRWSELSGLNFIYEANDDGRTMNASNSGGVLGTRADLRIGGRNLDGSGGTLAYNFFPNSGDMVIDTGDMGNYGQSGNDFRFLRNVVMHEAGHGLGCDHCVSNNRSILMEPFIDTSFDGPQLHDIMIMHRGYGDKNEKSNGGFGNDIQANATSLGALNNGGSVSIGNDARDNVVARTETDFVSIDDQSDTDFYSLTLNQDGVLDLTLEVLGDIYNIGAQGGGQSSFNTFNRSDLTLSVLNGAGSVIALANATGLGGDEVISQFLNAGTYAIRVTGLDNADAVTVDTQFYALSASFEAVPEPASMTLLALGGLAIARKRRKNS